MEEQNIGKIIEAVKKNDSEAIALLFRLVRPVIMRLCCLYLKNIQEVEDASEDIIFKVYSNILSLKDVNCFWGWLRRIIENHCKDIKRKKNEGIFSIELIEEPDKKNRVEKEILEDLYMAISALPLHYREILLLRYYEKKSIKEISNITEKSPATIKKYLSMARKQLKDSLLHMDKEE